MRKKIEMSTERVRLAKLKEEEAKKVRLSLFLYRDSLFCNHGMHTHESSLYLFHLLIFLLSEILTFCA